jgi:hypothetical protein
MRDAKGGRTNARNGITTDAIYGENDTWRFIRLIQRYYDGTTIWNRARKRCITGGVVITGGHPIKHSGTSGPEQDTVQIGRREYST